MRRTIAASTVIFLATTAAMGITPGRELVGASAEAATQERQIAPGGGVGSGNVILAKGDKSGTGPGHGGHKGAKKAEKKGGQKHDKDDKKS